MIPFPKMHVADSVLNRIMNTLEGKTTAPIFLPPPEPPDPEQLSLEIDSAVSQPAAAAAVPPGTEPAVDSAMATESAMGGSPFDAALGASAGGV